MLLEEAKIKFEQAGFGVAYAPDNFAMWVATQAGRVWLPIKDGEVDGRIVDGMVSGYAERVAG